MTLPLTYKNLVVPIVNHKIDSSWISHRYRRTYTIRKGAKGFTKILGLFSALLRDQHFNNISNHLVLSNINTNFIDTLKNVRRSSWQFKLDSFHDLWHFKSLDPPILPLLSLQFSFNYGKLLPFNTNTFQRNQLHHGNYPLSSIFVPFWAEWAKPFRYVGFYLILIFYWELILSTPSTLLFYSGCGRKPDIKKGAKNTPKRACRFFFSLLARPLLFFQIWRRCFSEPFFVPRYRKFQIFSKREIISEVSWKFMY